jgi:hypothetical protein
MSAPDVRWVRRPADIAFVDDGADRVAMLDLLHVADPPIVLEGTSAAIWRLLQQPISVPELSARLAEQYAAPVDVVAAGVESFLADLAARGLVVPQEGA